MTLQILVKVSRGRPEQQNLSRLTARPSLWLHLLPEMEGPVDVFASFVLSALLLNAARKGAESAKNTRDCRSVSIFYHVLWVTDATKSLSL